MKIEELFETTEQTGWFIVPARAGRVNALAGPFKTKKQAQNKISEYYVEDDIKVVAKYGREGADLNDAFEPLDEPSE